MTRVLNPIATAMIAAPAFMPGWAWAQGLPDADKYGYGPGMMWWNGGWYGMFFGPLFMILIPVAVIAVIVLLVQQFGAPGHASAPMQQVPPGRTPLDILKERFARGEIDKDEFEDRRRILGD